MVINTKNITINAQNSGTLGRLILEGLIDTPYPIKIIGDRFIKHFKEFQIHLVNLEQNLNCFKIKFTINNFWI